jgi:hypothetical protein
MFHDTSKLEIKLALYYMIAVVIVLDVAAVTHDVVWAAAGVSALLAWVTNLLGNPVTGREKVFGHLVFLVGGIGLSWLAHAAQANQFYLLMSVAIVSFAGATFMFAGSYWHIVGWCLTFWMLISPGFSQAFGLADLIQAHVIGAGAIFVYALIKNMLRQHVSVDAPAEPPITAAAIWTYAIVLAAILVAGMGMGLALFKTDTTLISVATLSVIGLNLRRTWLAVLERMMFATAGVSFGFYLGLYFSGPVIEQLVIAGTSFVAIVFLRRGFGPTVFGFSCIMSYYWGGMGFQQANIMVNEKLFGEFLGVGLAGLGVSIMAFSAQFFRGLHQRKRAKFREVADR